MNVSKSLKTVLELTPFMVGLAFVLAFLYLFAYWAGFRINVFEYMSISDVLIYTAPVLLGLLVGTAGGFPLIVFMDDLLRGARPRGEISLAKSKVPKLVIFSVLTLWMLVLVLFSIHNFVRIVVFLLLVIVYMRLTRSGILSADIPNKFVREIVLLFLIVLPYGAVEYGIQQREKITSGRAYKYVEAGHMSDASLYSPSEKLRYIGKAGDYFFLLREDGKSIVITQLSNFKSLELHEFP
jgi:hypothetical protein